MADDHSAVAALISDLQWQMDQMAPRGILNSAGQTYIPHYYKRGLKGAMQKGDDEVVQFVRDFVRKKPSDGFTKLGDANSLDLACEALVADPDAPYAHLFTEEDRELARKRLGPHLEAIEERKRKRKAAVEKKAGAAGSDLEALQARAQEELEPEDAAAVNLAITQADPADFVAHLRLGRAYESLGLINEAEAAFERVLEIKPDNKIARPRLDALRRRWRRD
jgi:tetratricopeptide (TPR) repeat protein